MSDRNSTPDTSIPRHQHSAPAEARLRELELRIRILRALRPGRSLNKY